MPGITRSREAARAGREGHFQARLAGWAQTPLAAARDYGTPHYCADEDWGVPACLGMFGARPLLCLEIHVPAVQKIRTQQQVFSVELGKEGGGHGSQNGFV